MGERSKYGQCRPKGYRVAATLRRAKAAINIRWTADELRTVESGVKAGLTLAEVHALFPYRTRDSVKDQYYRCRDPHHEPPASITDARRRKDAIAGSEALLEAIMRYHPEVAALTRAG